MSFVLRREFNRHTHVVVARDEAQALDYIKYTKLPEDRSVYLKDVATFSTLNIASIRIHTLRNCFDREDADELRELLTLFSKFNVFVSQVEFDCMYRP